MKDAKELPGSWVKEIPREDSIVSTVTRKSKTEDKGPHPGSLLGGYVLNEKIGQGSFGVVFEGHKMDSMKKVAIKIETYTDSSQKVSQLDNEYSTYIDLCGNPLFPKIEYFGQRGAYKFLVMEYLGMSLEDMLAIRNRKLCAKSIFMLGKRMIDMIEALHSIGKVHRDLKPDNFLIGRDPRKIYLIDLGMAKGYLVNGKHIPMTTGKRLTGTPRYASVNAHKGCELGRKDDLESIGYILVYLAKGKLPWQGLKESRREKCRKIAEIKKNIKIEELVQDLPGAEMLTLYFNYVKELGFEEKPNYAYLRQLMDIALERNNLIDDGVFEWEYGIKGANEDITNDSMDEHITTKRKIISRLKRFFCSCLS